MSTTATEAEIRKLARLLRRDPAALEYLQAVDPKAIRELRDQVTDVLFDGQRGALGRLALASRLLPVKIVAVIGEKAFGAVLAARITGLLDPARAAEMADTMPIEFLADIAVELDPRRASGVIERIPAARIALITRELLRREEYVTIGRFVSHLSDASVRAATETMSDRELLEVAFVLESKDSIDGLAEAIGPGRIDGIITVAARQGMWLEAIDLFGHLGGDRRRRLASEAAPALGEPDAIESLVRGAGEHSLWTEVLPFLSALPEPLQQRAAAEVRRLDPAQRAHAEQALAAAGMERELTVLRSATG